MELFSFKKITIHSRDHFLKHHQDVCGVYTFMRSVNDQRVLKLAKPRHLLYKNLLLASFSLVTVLSQQPTAFAQEIYSNSDFENLELAQVNSYIAQQNFTLSSIWRYAAAVQEINPIREKHNREIDMLLGEKRPGKVCYHQPIPRAVQESCKSFGAKMFQILRKHEVHDLYTPMSRQVQSDTNLEKKIQKAGICQQRGVSLNDCF